jgi:hypothetical protein
VGLDVAPRDQLEAIAARDLGRVVGLELLCLLEQPQGGEVELRGTARDLLVEKAPGRVGRARTAVPLPVELREAPVSGQPQQQREQALLGQRRLGVPLATRVE